MAHEKQLELNQETTEANSHFDSLMDLAVKTALRDPSKLYINLEVIRERDNDNDPLVAVFQEMGTSASAELIDRLNGEVSDADENDEDSEELLLPYDVNIKQRVEALGQTILDEAFECLGSDAPDKVKELQQAKTDQEFVTVMDWLIRRLKDIRQASQERFTPVPNENAEAALAEDVVVEPAEEEADLFYHPVRISPKFIGKFPEIEAEPTCLGYSILASSFFAKAQVPYMHAGVVSSAAQSARQAQLNAGLFLNNLTKDSNNFLSDDMQKLIDEGIDLNLQRIYGHTGFHAAVFARFKADRWFQMDFNFDTNILITSPATHPLEDTYEELLAKNKVDAAMEKKILNIHSVAPHNYLVAMQDLAEQLPDIEDIDQFLKDVPPELALSEIFERYFKDFIDFDVNTRNNSQLNFKVAFSEYCKLNGYNTINTLQSRIHSSIISGVFIEAIGYDDISECIERCKYDDAYRRRRAEDLRMAPMMVAYRTLINHGNAIIKNELKYPHSILEIGSPAYRIGASVLSDFAVICGDDLPLSFWMTYWPSSVSFAEHYKNSETPSQGELRDQIITKLIEDGLNYPLLDVIIKEVHE